MYTHSSVLAQFIIIHNNKVLYFMSQYLSSYSLFKRFIIQCYLSGKPTEMSIIMFRNLHRSVTMPILGGTLLRLAQIGVLFLSQNAIFVKHKYTREC